MLDGGNAFNSAVMVCNIYMYALEKTRSELK